MCSVYVCIWHVPYSKILLADKPDVIVSTPSQLLTHLRNKVCAILPLSFAIAGVDTRQLFLIKRWSGLRSMKLI